MISLQPDFPEALKKSLKEKVIKQNIKVIEKKTLPFLTGERIFRNQTSRPRSFRRIRIFS